VGFDSPSFPLPSRLPEGRKGGRGKEKKGTSQDLYHKAFSEERLPLKEGGKKITVAVVDLPLSRWMGGGEGT